MALPRKKRYPNLKKEAQRRAAMTGASQANPENKKKVGSVRRKYVDGVTALTPFDPRDGEALSKLSDADKGAFIKHNFYAMTIGGPVFRLEEWIAAGKPQAPKGGKFTPADPGVKNPAPTPFLKPEESIAFGDAEYKFSTERESTQQALKQMIADVDFGKAEVDRRASDETQMSQDEMIGRGLFQSSIKDGALWDIEKNRATSKSRLDDQLTMATTNTESALANLTNWWTNFQKNMDVIAVRNAQDLPTGPEYMPGKGPKPESFTPKKPPKPASSKQTSPGDMFKQYVQSVKQGFVGASRDRPHRPKRPNRPNRPKAGAFG